jgi:hypothetical protein
VSENYSEAAYRHFTDSERLAQLSRWDNAGHLVGFAAECAIKHGIATLQPAAGSPHGHFPHLVDIARKHLKSRRSSALHTLLKMPSLMKGWDVNLRYDGDGAVGQAQHTAWRGHATRLMGAAGLKR